MSPTSNVVSLPPPPPVRAPLSSRSPLGTLYSQGCQPPKGGDVYTSRRSYRLEYVLVYVASFRTNLLMLPSTCGLLFFLTASNNSHLLGRILLRSPPTLIGYSDVLLNCASAVMSRFLKKDLAYTPTFAYNHLPDAFWLSFFVTSFWNDFLLRFCYRTRWKFSLLHMLCP